MDVISKDKVFPTSKKIKIPGTASLTDLKAELLRKRQEATTSNADSVSKSSSTNQPKWREMADKLEQQGKLKEIRREPSKNSGSKKRADEDDDDLLNENLRKSREALERKAKLYDERFNQARTETLNVSRNSDDSSDSEDDNELVNFKLKIKMGEVPNSHRDYEDDDDYVEFTDSLGRTRRCLKKDVDHYRSLDENVNRPETPRDELINDDRSSASGSPPYGPMPFDYEEEEVKEIRPIRYEGMKQDEVREHGVAHYAFSTDEAEREKQMKYLDHLREETKKHMELRKQRKLERKEKKKARLEKMASEGLPMPEEESESSSEEESTEQFVSTTDERDAQVLAEKEDKPRDWDLGKKDEAGRIVKELEKTWDYSNFAKPSAEPVVKPTAKKQDDVPKAKPKASVKGYIKERREDRDESFAPPSSYFFEPPRPAKKFRSTQSTMPARTVQPDTPHIHASPFSVPPPDLSKKPDEISRTIDEQLSFLRNNAE
ncbi:Coiled-coil domain-containing protein [Halotydeus destructor]|nr:Coiled-coil domain-containing protein [Halotydeus destructor]